MRVPLTLRQSWPAQETIVPLAVPVIDPPGWVRLYASRNAWHPEAMIYIALEFLDADDDQWKALVPIHTHGGIKLDRRGNLMTHSIGETRKYNPLNGLSAPYFRHTWPRDERTRIPTLRLRVITTRAINSLIEVDW